MTKKESYESRVEAFLLPLMEENNFELVDVEYVKEGSMWYLRAYIDKPGGITVNDCEAVSRRFSDILDEKDYIEDSYIFEVSSPGLGRPLKKEKDFKRSLGKSVECKLYKAINKQKEFEGILKDFTEDTVTIETEGNELVLDRKLSEKRMFPAIDILKSGTRREDLLLSKEEQEAVESMRRALNGLRPEEAVDNILNMFSRTRNNEELIQMVKKTKFI